MQATLEKKHATMTGRLSRWGRARPRSSQDAESRQSRSSQFRYTKHRMHFKYPSISCPPMVLCATRIIPPRPASDDARWNIQFFVTWSLGWTCVELLLFNMLICIISIVYHLGSESFDISWGFCSVLCLASHPIHASLPPQNLVPFQGPLIPGMGKLELWRWHQCGTDMYKRSKCSNNLARSRTRLRPLTSICLHSDTLITLPCWSCAYLCPHHTRDSLTSARKPHLSVWYQVLPMSCQRLCRLKWFFVATSLVLE